ncbi:MAG: hypothetical protein JW822_01980 [Spirochaetales bacterium]|nr:hypothetical protein [Spirochaetales bacterium]
MKITAICCSLFFLFCLSTHAKELYVKDKGYYLDLPAEWQELDTRDTAAMSFVDPGHTTIFQLFCFPAPYFENAYEMLSFIKVHLNAEGEGAPFIYSASESYFADLSFSTQSYHVRGYFVFINGDTNDYVLMCFTQVKEYSRMHDFLLSCLDSFSPDKKNKLLPGPISQFYYQFPGVSRTTATIPFKEKFISFSYDKNEIEATEVVISREARILTAYHEVNTEAWSRFYRIIYRDNFARFTELSQKLQDYLQAATDNRTELVSVLLEWIQRFIYGQNQGITDITPPLQAVLTHSGDCDTRAVLFLILLHHMKIDAVLLVSDRYKHSAVGIALEASGAKLKFNGKQYVFAELTTQVALGMIAQSMADPSGWYIFRLGN